MKTKSTVLKSIAVAGALTAAGTVAATTAHADAVNNAAPANAASVSTTNADQQLANLKSQQTANENAVAASNAATMSAASDAANKQIADINNQIANRQASDAAAHQAAIASQTNAINSAATSATNAENASYSDAVAKQSAENAAAIKSAEAGISTPAQKQRETAQENAIYQNDVNKLGAAHNDNVNKINSDYQGQEAAASQKITDAQNAAAKGQQDALANATKQVDGQIADANKAVNDAQTAVNNDQKDLKTKTDASNQANTAAKAAQSTLTSDQAALDAAKKAAESGQTTETTDKLNVPQDYINVWKEYYDNTNDWQLTQKDHPELWERNKEASAKAKEMNKDFVASEQDKNTPVHLNTDGTLSRDDVIIATKYAAELINPIREAIGVKPYEITNASIDMNMENTKKYRAKGHNDWRDKHDTQLLGQIADEWNAGALSESLAGNWSIAQKKDHLTVADLKEAVHQAVIDLLFEGADGSDNGHTTDLLGVRYHKGSILLGGADLLGVDYDLDPVNHNGWIRFNSIGDDKGDRVQNMVKQGYIMKQGTSADKTIQGNEYDHIAVPTPDSQSDAAAKLQKQISDLSDKVAKDTNAVKLANSAASDAASALKSAQDKLSQDQKTLGDAQAKLNNLKQNRDKMIKDLVSDPAQNAAAKGQQDALANATKQVDGQIADANKAASDAQTAVNNDQNDVKTKTDASNQANAAAKAAQSTLTSDQAALDAAKKAAESGQTTETTDKLNVPQDYINVWKEYKNNSDDWLLTKEKNPDLWERNKEASAKAKEMNKGFVASEQDKNTPIHFNSDGTLSREDVIIATKYAAELINPVREAIGENPYEITNASIDMTMENASKYRAKGHNDWHDSHDSDLLNSIAHEWGKFQMGESLAGNWSLAPEKNLSVADLKEAVHQAVIDLLFEGADGSDNGHTTDLLNVRYQKSQNVHTDFLGVTFDADPVNHNGWIRFNSIQDGKSAQTKKMLDEGYDVPDGTAKDKTIQGSNYDHIAVPTPDSQSDAAAKLQKQISDLTDKVAKDANAVKLANSAASDAASALESAQDKLAQDQKTLGDAQAKLNNLKQNRDKMIKDLVSDPSGSKLIQNLQDQLDAIKAKHADAIKAENADYTAKLQTLKKNHENKLAEIQAQPENVNGLKAQLQSKLDALKKDHEAKLAAIQNDAKTKIEALKKQAGANDPEIAKLQGQIDAIKDNLAKQQKKLDDQFAALKAKDEADYNALAQKLKNSSSEAAKGHNDHYNAGDGHEVVLPGDHDGQKGDQGNTTPSKPSDSQSSKGDDHQDQTTPVAPIDNQGTKTDDQEATNPAEPAKGDEAVADNGAVKISYPVDNSASVDTAAPAATVTPMTREAVKAQNAKNNGKSLPQTGNENGIVAMALGTMLAMFGLGVSAKKRY